MDPGVVAAEWGWTLPLFVACLGPGAVVAWRFLGRLRLNAAELGAVAFALTVALFSAAAIVAWLVGGGLDSAGALLAAALGALGVWASVAEMRGSRLEPVKLASVDGGWSGLALAAAAALVAMIRRPWFFTSTDAFYHVAAVRSLVRTGQVFATDPIYGTATDVIDPTSGVWHSVLALFARGTGMEPSTLYLPAMAVGAFVLVCSIWALMRRVSGDDRVADGMTLVLLVAMYGMDLRTSGYPNEVAYGLALLAAALLARAVEEGRRGYAWLAGLVGLATVTTHLGCAELVGFLGLSFVTWTAVVAWVSRTGEDAVPIKAVGYPMLALAVAFVPALPVLAVRLSALSGSVAIGDAKASVIGREVVALPLGMRLMVPGFSLGPVAIFVAGVAACIWAVLRSRRHGGRVAVAVAAVAALPTVLFVNPLLGSLVIGYSAHMARRLALLLRFAPWVGIAWAIGTALAGRTRERRVFAGLAGALAAGCLVLLMLLGNDPAAVVFEGAEAKGASVTWAADRRSYWGADALSAARAEFARHDEPPVVAGPATPVYELTGLTDVRALSVVEGHSPYHVERVSGRERRRDADRLLSPGTPASERRAVLAKWDVEYLVFDDTPRYRAARAAALADTRYLEPVVVTDRFTLLRVRR